MQIVRYRFLCNTHNRTNQLHSQRLRTQLHSHTSRRETNPFTTITKMATDQDSLPAATLKAQTESDAAVKSFHKNYSDVEGTHLVWFR